MPEDMEDFVRDTMDENGAFELKSAGPWSYFHLPRPRRGPASFTAS